MILVKWIYTIYAGLLFAITYILQLPVFWLSARKTEWHVLGLKTNRFWAKFYFPMIFMPVRIEFRYRPEKREKLIICANHFSYFDIPALVWLPTPFKFIGKSSIANIPLFGYMFRKLHLSVDRSSFRDRADSLNRAREAVENGFNLAFFPEGGVRATHPPKMVPFRDGAFKLAVEKQLPILPVSMPNNYKILPDDGKYLLSPGVLKIVVHEPIRPTSTNDDEIEVLKQKVFDVIQQDLNKSVSK
ncbi:MAG: 1-acyl-sn-glycerol-3-phosphate acyltransferase [Cyclobacteriaceae bacterium]